MSETVKMCCTGEGIEIIYLDEHTFDALNHMYSIVLKQSKVKVLIV